MRNTKWLLTAVLVTFSQLTFANSPWKNIGPLKSGDVSIFLDFQVQYTGDVPPKPPTSVYLATPLWLNVNRPGLQSSDHVKVMLISYLAQKYRGQAQGISQDIKEYDLTFAEAGRFTKQIQPLVIYQTFNDGYALRSLENFKTEIVVWINGQLYKGDNGQNIAFELRKFL